MFLALGLQAGEAFQKLSNDVVIPLASHLKAESDIPESKGFHSFLLWIVSAEAYLVAAQLNVFSHLAREKQKKRERKQSSHQ